MIRCLEDKTLFLMSEGEASEEQRSHLQSCQACTERYHEIERDLRLITHTLQREVPPLRFTTSSGSIFFRSLPLAAGVLLAIALVWGESRLWRLDSSSEQTLSGDISQFLEQVADAIFDRGSMGEVEPASSDSDLASVQVALGENCSDDCRGLFNNSLSTTNTKSKTKAVDRPVVTAKRRPIDPTMQRMVSDRTK
jgi:hypothetical protein